MTGLLRQRDVRLIVGAVGVSSVGDFLLWVPLTLYLQRTNGSALVVAGLFLALWSPAVVLAPFAGWLVDRLEARAVLIVASLAQAAIAASLAFVLDSTTAILVLAVLLGIGFSVAQPAEFSLVPVIGASARLTEVNGLVETARYGGATAGPLLGGLLAGVGGTRAAMFVNAASFLAVALAGLALQARRRAEPAELDRPDRLRDGVVVLFRERALALVLSVALVSLLFMSASVTAEVFFVKRNLHASDFGYGIVFACWTVGMALGSLLIARRVRTAALAVGALVAVGVQGFGLGLPTAWLVIPFGCALWFVGGLGHGTKNVLARTLIQEQVPSRLHGRAFAAYNGLRNGAELIALAAGGLLVAAIGARTTLALAGAIPLLAALAGLAVYRARLPAEEAPTASAPSLPSG
ncbi:MAG TPA: MFS transporter [Gaiellaceae bacterium]|jgi:MFS family permease